MSDLYTQFDQWQRTHTCQWKTADLLWVLDSAQRPSVYLEIGSWQGGSLRAMASRCKAGACLVSVDRPYRPENLPILNESIKWLRGQGFETHQVTGDSTAEDTRTAVQKLLAGRAVELLLIDGGHEYETVRQDWDAWSPFVSDGGGAIVLHDVRAFPGPARLFCELLQDGYRANYRMDEHGVGVLWK